MMMKKRLLSLFVCTLCTTLSVVANDGSYYASGNLLFPLQETAIAVRSEVLTISICDDGYATIDVLYNFYNNGPSKTIAMAFESPLPYNTGSGFSHVGKHPFVRDFTATLNGKDMSCRSAVVVGSDTDVNSYKTYSPNKWYEADGDFDYGWHYITNGKDTVEVSAYAYLFKASFKPGLNTVHHTYRYKASGGLSANFEIPYILQPCTRWANHQVDDFTLRIAAPSTAKHFYVLDDVLRQTSFSVVSGTGKVRGGILPPEFEEGNRHYQEISLRDGVVECHIKDFKPEANLFIVSTDHLMMLLGDKTDVKDMKVYYNRGWMQMPMVFVNYDEFYGPDSDDREEPDALTRRIMRNLPYADRGYVFRDSRLRRYFESQWWYMPDPTWEMSTDGFTDTDWNYVRGGVLPDS